MGISLLEEYERVLLSGGEFTASSVKNATTNSVLSLYRYAFSSLLGWSPERVHEKISPKVLKFLRLDKFLSKIPCPAELDPHRDYFYIAEAMYPELMRVSTETRVIYTYQMLLDGKIQKLPKKFFSTVEAPEFACTCLRVAISQDLDVGSTEALYKMFANAPWARAFLKKKSLLRPCEMLYQTPLDYLHDALPETQKSEALYMFVRFAAEWKKATGAKGGKLKNVKSASCRIGSVPVQLNWTGMESFIKSLPDGGLKNSYQIFMEVCKSNPEIFA